MALNTPKNEDEVLAKFQPDQIRNVMVYLGSDEHVRKLMLNNGTINQEDAEYLDSIAEIEEFKNAVLRKIFAVLQGETEVQCDLCTR